jgi:hypothetical protein
LLQDLPDPGDTSSDNESQIDPSEGLIRHFDDECSHPVSDVPFQQATAPRTATTLSSLSNAHHESSSSSQTCTTSCNKSNSVVDKVSVEYSDSNPTIGQSTESMIDPHDCGALKVDSRDTHAALCPAASSERAKLPAWMEPYEVRSEEFPDLNEMQGDVLIHTNPTLNDCSDW